jgi:hypothetical protein
MTLHLRHRRLVLHDSACPIVILTGDEAFIDASSAIAER